MSAGWAGLLALAGAALGVLAGFFWGRSRVQEPRLELERARAELAGVRERLADHQQRTTQLEQALEAARAEARRSAEAFAAEQARREQAEQAAAQRLSDLERLQQEATARFQLLSQQILEEKSQRFTASNREQIEQLLRPLGEKISQFEQQVKQTYEYETRDRRDLFNQIRELQRLNEQVSGDANSLAAALKGDQRVQGVWGEVILERLLERSGLRRGSEFDTQVSVTTDEGRQRPDAVIYLPEQRHLIVDAKVSLSAYVEASNATDAATRDAHLARHLASMRSHIVELARRNYADLPGFVSVDFVLMFLPSEAAYVEALRLAPQLFEDAFERRVVLVSPSTLLPTLRAVANVWRLERQVQNATEVFTLAGRLYDKFVGFATDLEAVQKALARAQESVGLAHDKLSRGRGNLVGQAQRLVEMGAKASKQLPMSFAAVPGPDAESPEEP